MKLKHNRKGSYSLQLTLIFIFINVLLFIMISAFGQDGETIGSGGGTYGEFTGNTSADLSVSDGEGWLGGFVVQFFDMPWWVIILISVFEISVASLCIYGLVRGI